jgi:translocation and assembly module TamA
MSAEGNVPITFDFEERPKHALGATGAYSTDLGGMVRGTWSDRNLFGAAEQLNLSATVSGLGGTATTGIGYALTAQLLKPDFLRRDQTLEFNASALQQNLEAYDQTAFILGTALRRKFSRRWSGGIGLTGEQERITQQGVTRDYTLLSVPITAKYDSTDLTDLLQDPTHGIRAAFTVTPTQSFGATGNPFVILQASASTYVDLSAWASAPAGRSVIAIRGLVGSIQGASQFDVPPDKRFYGGGSATARGYKYQSIGPLFPDDHPIGGTAIDAVTFEYRQRLFGDFGAVAFVDAAQVSARSTPFNGPLRIGVGAGARYYTSFGPIRLDFAVPLNRPPGGDAFEIYIGIGQAF